MSHTPPTPLATLTRARRIARQHGIRYAYTGNVIDAEGSATYCHQCDKRIIGRDWSMITDWHVTNEGRCQFCNTACAGAFAGPPGSWGAKRLPVRLADFAT